MSSGVVLQGEGAGESGCSEKKKVSATGQVGERVVDRHFDGRSHRSYSSVGP
jgi:hypothetical protein